MRTEGVYTYLCSKCGAFFAIVSRLTVTSDYSESLRCPKCGGYAAIHGEGHITHQTYESNKIVHEVKYSDTKNNSYPEILNVTHVAEIMGVSKRVAYEMMEYKGFPLIRVGRLKRVNKQSFFDWLKQS